MAAKRLFLLPLLALTALLLSYGEPRAEDSYTYAAPSFTAEYDALSEGKPFYAMLTLDIAPHWHTYWYNPGDSGLSTEVVWDELPAGLSISPIGWLPPKRVVMPPLTNYGYEGAAHHLFRITPPAEMPAEGITLTGKSSWLVCKETCIPERADISLTVAKGESDIRSSAAGAVEDALTQARLPGAGAEVKDVTEKNFSVIITLPENTAAEGIKQAYFFPKQDDLIEHSAKQPFTGKGHKLTLTLTRGYGDVPDTAEGFLRVTFKDGTKNIYRVGAHPGWLGAAGAVSAAAPDSAGESGKNAGAAVNTVAPVTAAAAMPPAAAPAERSLFVILLFAFLGGIILNAMPCVFPVLSLKAVSISAKAAASPGAARMNGVCYTAGVLAGFLIAAIALLALKSAGESVGWGFQMQSPVFVGAMAMLLFLVGLNLAGYFDITLMFGGNVAAASKGGLKGAFFTGLLAAAVATPCTAPFMATALGVALSKPPAVAVIVFLALGLGLAFPYLLLTFIPALTRMLPRPGAWMETFRRALAFPMFLSAVWLLWVLMQQTDPNGAALLMTGMICAAAALRISARALRKPIYGALFLALSLFAIAPFFALTPHPRAAGTAVQSGNSAATGSRAYSEARLNELRDAGKPVFVYATAAWCITCKVNERVALKSRPVQDLFAERGIAVLRADWTNEDPHITAFLERFGRNGVPLYVYFAGKDAEPVILPQLLSPAIVAGHITTADEAARENMVADNAH